MPSHPQGENVACGRDAAELDPIQRALRDNEDWYRTLSNTARTSMHSRSASQLLSVNPCHRRVCWVTALKKLLRIPMQGLSLPNSGSV